MKIPDSLKFIAIGLMLFASVAVDFVSKIMSIGFDLFFISLAVWIAYPMIVKKKKEENS